MKNITFKGIWEKIKGKRKIGKGISLGKNPDTDWKIVFIAFSILFIVVLGFSTYIFLEINQGDIFEVQSAPPSNTNSTETKTSKTIIDFYTAKGNQFNTLKNTRPFPVIDPAS